jgi:hypothetical protein
MSNKRFFNAKYTVSLFAVVLFAIAFVTVGCSSSNNEEEAEVTEETVEAPETTEAEPSPTSADTVRSSPPQEVIDACVGLNEGDDCAVTLTNGSMTGACKTVRTGDLACMPKARPGKPVQRPSDMPPPGHFEKPADRNGGQ